MKAVNSYYPTLDGLRGIAIILVILYHNFGFLPYCKYGWLGVDLFFVISGFLITSILLASRNKKYYFRNFYLRRILRIFPMYYLSLFIFFFIIGNIGEFEKNFAFARENQLWFWTYLQNWLLSFKYDYKSTGLNHFWSLALEEQFYLVWPPIIYYIRDSKKLIFVIFCLLIAVNGLRIWIWNYRDFFADYEKIFLFTRIDGITLGSLIAIKRSEETKYKQRYFITLIIALTFTFLILKNAYVFGLPSMQLFGFTTISTTFALMLYYSLNAKKSLTFALLTASILKFFGKHSYAIYVFHWPVYLILKPYLSNILTQIFEEKSILEMTLSSVLATVPTLILSFLTYNLFEIYFLRLKQKLY